jgi:hypothetical protein
MTEQGPNTTPCVSVDNDLLWALHSIIYSDQRDSIRFKVDLFDGLRVMIFFDEHPPPHFAVTCDGQTASFAITTGERLPKNRGLEKHERKIKKWWKANRARLVEIWNSSRPTDCSVGPISPDDLVP